MEKEKPTPLPWRADTEQGCVVSDAGMICDIGFMNVHPEANAEFIVRAANSHQLLVDTIRNALTTVAIVRMPVMSRDVATDNDLLDIMAESFKAALAEAEKGTK